MRSYQVYFLQLSETKVAIALPSLSRIKKSQPLSLPTHFAQTFMRYRMLKGLQSNLLRTHFLVNSGGLGDIFSENSDFPEKNPNLSLPISSLFGRLHFSKKSQPLYHHTRLLELFVFSSPWGKSTPWAVWNAVFLVLGKFQTSKTSLVYK